VCGKKNKRLKRVKETRKKDRKKKERRSELRGERELL
jgi:hypothetical protein